ncbi:hypothetical protein [Burkholderia diffusa]|uniref:hypothetical protein n=1 Tax=Burkholderia diffusa TaxID=488732 RepID=UPI000754D57B|nr:hypothetical protein [Burkholderia diffusa]KVH47347.1 hypothetical protein WJ39_15660 [Burkholderia diffusa]
MDYRKLFKFRASVDWLSFEIETASSTHATTLRDELDVCGYVTPLDKSPGGAATRFSIPFQDIRSWDDAQSRWEETRGRLKALKRLPLDAPEHDPVITGIEVSFDAYARTATRDDLIDMAVRFFAFGNVVADYRSSGVWLNGVMIEKVAAVMSRHDVRRLFANDRVINIGDRDDDLTQRVYFKTKDSGEPLPEERHRARAEVTLKRTALPFKTLAAARRFEFQTLAKSGKKYFSYRKQLDGMEPLPALIHSRYAQVGMRKERRTEKRGKLLYDPKTQADTELNRLARDKLAELTKRM